MALPAAAGGRPLRRRRTLACLALPRSAWLLTLKRQAGGIRSPVISGKSARSAAPGLGLVGKVDPDTMRALYHHDTARASRVTSRS